MQISSRFTIAIHIFSCINTFEKENKITSDFLAGSINVNPVIIRKLLSQLKAAGFVNVQRGSGGASIASHWSRLRSLTSIMQSSVLTTGSFFTFMRIPIPNVLWAGISTASSTANCNGCRKKWNVKWKKLPLLM